MRSHRFYLALLLLLVVALLITAALGTRMRSLEQRVENFDGEREQLQQEQDRRVEQLNQQLRELKKERDEAERGVRNLERQLNSAQQVQQERDELKNQLAQERQRASELQQLIDNLESMNQINQQILGLRGLAPQKKLPRKIMSRGAYRDYLNATLDEDFPPAEEQRERAKLIALDMIDPGLNLRQAIVDGQVSSVLGFYDPRSEELFVISDRGHLGVEDRVTYAHEYTHYLQDQAFGLDQLMTNELNTDEGLALRALVEGDAVLSMELWAQDHLSGMDKFDRQLGQFRYVVEAMSAGWGDSGGAVVESIGHFPYTAGTEFAVLLYIYDDGWGGVNRGYRKPPRSTAQILHPELYFEGVQPVAVKLPDLASSLGAGWRQADNNVLGELYLRVYLEHQISFQQAIPAADGWRGDRYQVLEGPNGERAFALRVLLADAYEAGELFSAYESYIGAKSSGALPSLVTERGRQWQLADRQVYLGRAGREVLILHGNDSATTERLKQAFPGF